MFAAKHYIEILDILLCVVNKFQSSLTPNLRNVGQPQLMGLFINLTPFIPLSNLHHPLPLTREGGQGDRLLNGLVKILPYSPGLVMPS